MKFGNYLKEFSVEKWRLYYVNYQYLKSVVKGFKKSSLPTEALERSFMAAIDEEVIKVNNFFMVTAQQLSAKLDSFIKLVSHENFYVSSPEVLQKEIDGMTADLVDLDRYTKVNFEAFRKIMKKYDRHTAHQALPWFMQRLKEQPFHTNSNQFSSLILKFSKCCSGCRRILGEDPLSVSAESEAPLLAIRPLSTNFEDTIKFFIEPVNVMSVKAHITRHLPIFLYNPAGSGKDAKESSSLFSCYYEKPASFTLYEGRLRNSSDICSIRFRTFDQSKTVFIEKKTHYGGEGRAHHSVKDTIDLPAHHIHNFILGSFKPSQYKVYLTERGVSIQEQEKSMVIFSEVQQIIADQGLRPALSAQYKRTFFKVPGNPKVTIEMDEDVEFIKEPLAFSKEAPKWHRNHDSVPSNETHELPYAVLVIKLQLNRGEERPLWLQNLLVSSWLQDASPFSKFLHGMALLHPATASLGRPQWIDQFVKEDQSEKSKEKEEAQEEERTTVTGGGWNIQFLEEDEEDSPDSSLLQRPGDKKKDAGGGLWSRLQSVFHLGDSVNSLNPEVDLKVEPKTFFANERTFIQWASFCIVIQTIGVAFVGFSSSLDSDHNNGVAKVGGEAYLVIAFCFLLYSLYNYRVRAAKIRAQEHGNYDDFYGPFFLVVALSIACILNLIISFSN